MVKEGETGYLYETGAEFRAAITTLARPTVEVRQRMSAACQAWAARFSWSDMCNAYCTLYEAIAAKSVSAFGGGGRLRLADHAHDGPDGRAQH